MSELSDTLNRAILTFTHASDFIVSLYEGAHMMAEEMSERMAKERKLYQARLGEQIKIENDIGAAVAFSSKLLPAFLVMQISLLEDWLLEICQLSAQQEDISYPDQGAGRFTIQQARSFFEEKLGIQFPHPWTAWEKVLEFQQLRDEAVNHPGLEIRQRNVSDSLLVDVNKTIVSFLEELKMYLPEPQE